MSSQAKADELQERLIDFAVRIIRMAEHMPRSPAGRHLTWQILRSGTSPAANYGEARGAESRADFTHKLTIARKELNETCIWLQIIQRSELLHSDRLSNLLDEAGQLARIVNASVGTSRRPPAK